MDAERKHLVKSAKYWYDIATNPNTVISKDDAVFAMKNAYNHVETALNVILEKFPDAKKEFERIQKHFS